MPTYVYKFLETGETIEVQQSFSEDSLTEALHPGTGRPMAVRKVFTPVGVTFKGGGFYKTDSRNGSKSSGASTPAATPAADSSTTTSSSDASASTASSSTTPSTSSTSSTSSD